MRLVCTERRFLPPSLPPTSLSARLEDMVSSPSNLSLRFSPSLLLSTPLPLFLRSPPAFPAAAVCVAGGSVRWRWPGSLFVLERVPLPLLPLCLRCQNPPLSPPPLSPSRSRTTTISLFPLPPLSPSPTFCRGWGRRRHEWRRGTLKKHVGGGIKSGWGKVASVVVVLLLLLLLRGGAMEAQPRSRCTVVRIRTVAAV